MDPIASAETLTGLIDDRPGMVYRCRGAPRSMTAASDGCLALTGYDSAAITADGHVWDGEVVHADDRDAVVEAVRSAVERGEGYEREYRIRRSDGETRWVADRGEVSDPGEQRADSPVVEGYLVDVTERKERERDLARSEGLLDSIFEQIPVHLFVKDEAGRHVRVSRAFDDPEAFLGKRDVDIDFTSDEHARRAYADDMDVIRTGEPIVDKLEHESAGDRWHLTSKVPWRDGDEIVGLIGVTRNVTEQVENRRELERKTERLERFASVVSHDLRNPLTTARGYLDLADEERGGEDENLAAAREALDRMEELVEDVLTLARQGDADLDTATVSLSAVAESAWSTAETGDAALCVDDRDVLYSADSSRLRQLLSNLFRNAVEHGSTSSRSETDDAVEHGGEGVAVRVGPLGDDSGSSGTGADGVCGFYVADDGPGVPPGEREDVFETGYTRSADGTGLGLAIVRELARAHGWTVAVEESAEGGARFEVRGVERVDG